MGSGSIVTLNMKIKDLLHKLHCVTLHYILLYTLGVGTTIASHPNTVAYISPTGKDMSEHKVDMCVIGLMWGFIIRAELQLAYIILNKLGMLQARDNFTFMSKNMC